MSAKWRISYEIDQISKFFIRKTNRLFGDQTLLGKYEVIIIENFGKFLAVLKAVSLQLQHYKMCTSFYRKMFCGSKYYCGKSSICPSVCPSVHPSIRLRSVITDSNSLSDLCRSVSESEGRRHLRSSGRSQLVLPRYSLATVGRRAFGYAGPKAWNSLPDYLRCGDLSLETFKRQLKTFLFAHY